MDYNKLCPHCMNETDVEKESCEFCGKNPKEMPEITHHLKPFTILQGKYLVGDILGEGGFGITYIGLDINLEVKVAIKEFFPNGYCTRDGKITTEVTAYSGQNLEVVTKWRDNFMKEARALAKCSNLPGVVGVRDFFYENSTAYIVLEYLEGMTLKEIMKASGGKIAADQLLPAVKPVIEALSEVHKNGLIHRDISPDNIMRLKSGQMKLLDFGAARDFVQNDEKSLSVLLKPGYAPEEQYRTKGSQGPWSDVYALAGTIYKCLTGVTPPEALERLRKDELKRPSELGVPLNLNRENAIMKALAVLAEDRFQTVDDFKAALYENGENPPMGKSVASDVTMAMKNPGIVSTETEDNSKETEATGQESVKEESTGSINLGGISVKKPAFIDNIINGLKANPQLVPLYVAVGVVALVCIVLGLALIVTLNKKPDYTAKEESAVVESPVDKYEVTVKEEPEEEVVDTAVLQEELQGYDTEEEVYNSEPDPVVEEPVEEEIVYPPIDVDIDAKYYEIMDWVYEHDKYLSNYQHITEDEYELYIQDGTIVKMIMHAGYYHTDYPSIHHGVDYYYIEVLTESGSYQLFYEGQMLIRCIDPYGNVYDYGCEGWQDCVEFAQPYADAEAVLRGSYGY